MYGIRRLKRLSEKYGRVVTLNSEDIEHAQAWFNRHGHLAVFFGRLMPTVRSLISVPAGIARMPFLPFIFYSFLGTSIWTMMLLFLGYVLESQYEKISVYVDYLSNGIIIAFVSIYFYRVITYKKVRIKDKK
jgi:membrane protein DedA with SNARE-associated domain